VAAGTVQHVSASYLATQGSVRLHIKAVEHDKPQDFLLAWPDIEPFVTLLLMMSGQASASENGLPPPFNHQMIPLPINAVGVGQTEAGEAVIQLSVGSTALAFELPARATQQLGQSLLALGASPLTGSA
jgi:hypothetical protein